jgi:hypothetical protein
LLDVACPFVDLISDFEDEAFGTSGTADFASFFSLIGEGDVSFFRSNIAAFDFEGGVKRSASLASVFAFFAGGGVARRQWIASGDEEGTDLCQLLSRRHSATFAQANAPSSSTGWFARV